MDMKGGYRSLRTKIKYGILMCIALFVVVQFTKRGHMSIVNNSAISDNHVHTVVHDENVINVADGEKFIDVKDREKVINDTHEIVILARRISLYNKTVLVTVVNDAYLPFAYSWLCNTKHMGIHRSVLVITTDSESKTRLNQDWPEVTVAHIQLGIPKGDQDYSHVGYVKIMIRRTEIILALLRADIELLLLEFDYVWFSNPIPGMQRKSGVDMLVNPVSKTKGTVFNGGLLYLFVTERTKALWTKVTEMMWELEEKIQKKTDKNAVSEGENDQIYLTKLIREKYANVTTELLTLDIYADGTYYSMSEEERKKLHPIVISNNWVIGNKKKIERAKKWNHWFLTANNTCDTETVKKIVYT